ncbi:hypothetical protein GOP47_0017609 [Adiantum capillus-veneris]|uniref:Uncharacterized protein n=1 Tax=Adiantum capillus-veneris TaxID=13818 RepID=A0A9D4UGW1_ADICA|nr:hypothetical protein GOP47_0017609 [Adiantum capillus-veneris]
MLELRFVQFSSEHDSWMSKCKVLVLLNKAKVRFLVQLASYRAASHDQFLFFHFNRGRTVIHVAITHAFAAINPFSEKSAESPHHAAHRRSTKFMTICQGGRGCWSIMFMQHTEHAQSS